MTNTALAGPAQAPAPSSAAQSAAQSTQAVGKRITPLGQLLRDGAAVAAAVYLSLIVVIAVIGPFMTPHDPNDGTMRERLRVPWYESVDDIEAIRAEGEAALAAAESRSDRRRIRRENNIREGSARQYHPEFMLGSDNQGRDVLSRLVFGLRNTLLIGVLAVVFGGTAGALLGILAAYYKRLENVIMRFVDILLSFPSILLGLALAAVLTPGLPALIIALAVTAVPSIARVTRGAATVVMNQDYIEAGRALGESDLNLITRYLIPNCFSTIMVYMTLQFGQAILVGAALSFLGLGIQPPYAELGKMASEGRNFLNYWPHVTTLPSLLIFSVVLAFNVLGDALRDVLDPRLRK